MERVTRIALASFIPLFATAAHASPECMTKSEARAAHPTAHLYWHGEQHCWDNHPSARRKAMRALAQEKPKNDSKPHAPSDANANDLRTKRKAAAEVVYPVLVRKQAAIASDMYAMQRPITEWPLLLDIDATGPPELPAPDFDLERGVDGCCWPPLESLK